MPKKKTATRKTATKKQPQSKTEYVLGLPKTLSATDVVKKAKAAGIAISVAYVHNIRSAAKRKGKKRPAKGRKVAAKKARVTTRRAKPAKKRSKVRTARKRSKAKTSKKLSKKDYVLSLPKGLSAAEVVDKAKGDGISLTSSYVYKVRGKGKTVRRNARAAKKPVATPAARAQAKAGVRATPRTGSPEERFVDLVLDIGLTRAGELLSTIKERVKGLTLR